jgi:DNA processing protein
MRTGKDDEDAIQRKKTLLRMILVPGLGLRSCHQILAHVHDPRAVVSLKPADLKLFGIKLEVARDFLSRAAEDRAETEWNRTATLGVRIIDMKDPRFPQLLLETSDPPLVLYIRGMAWQPERPHIAVVGARQASAYGTNCAERFARELADRGIVVVSGLARGIDTAAHTGALSKGSTVAIFGTGIDRVYPAENRKLAESIVQKGAILSEFPLGTEYLRA